MEKKNNIYLSENSCSECRFWTNLDIALLLTFYNQGLLVGRGRVPVTSFKRKICYICLIQIYRNKLELRCVICNQ